MSRYVITEDQLTVLQSQIRELGRLSGVKDERIKDLEKGRTILTGVGAADFLTVVGKLENEINDLKAVNRQLYDINNGHSRRIEELEMLLREERKLREYSENLAREIQAQFAGEALIRQLTSELCQLQKDEIEVDNRRISDLERRIERMTDGEVDGDGDSDAESAESVGSRSNLNLPNDVRLKSVIYKLRQQLVRLYDQVNAHPSPLTMGDDTQKEVLDIWLTGIGEVVDNLNDIQDIRKDLNKLKKEIEIRKKYIPKSGQN